MFSLVAALLATAGVPSAGAADNPWLRPPDFEATGGYGQIAITDAEPGDTALLGRWIIEGDDVRVEMLPPSVIDEQGSVIFRELAEGIYLAATGGTIAWVIEVRDIDHPHPGQSFYDYQELGEGFQYIETRDGTLLSANVVLPGPIEDGPYPTVVEYSGYDPSNPTDGVPAQPGSLIANALGYAIVGVNIRGTGCSGGAYDFFERLQVLDGYDVIEAVAAQPWVLHNEVGMVGLSYPGISQLFVAQSNPPHLAAITPLSVYGDTATGVLAPGGLLNTGFATSWANNVLNNAEPYGTGWVNEVIAGGDTTCDDNQKLRLQNVDAEAKARANPFYTDEVAGPLDIRNFAGDIEAPVFLASATGDEQTGPSFGDLLGEFESSSSVRTTFYNGLHADGFAPQIIAEWAAFLDLYVAKRVPEISNGFRFAAPILTEGIFGGPVLLPPDRWGDVATHAEALARWESEPEIRILFENGAGGTPGLPIAGWETASDEWPLADTVATRWWLGADGSLSSAPGDPAGTGVAFNPDPAVATTSFHDGGSIWDKDHTWNWVPQADGDNARFQTEPLAEDVVMVGTASVDLWLRSDAAEAELEAVLSEVRADGQEQRVQAGQLQAGYRALDASSTELQPVQYGREEGFAPLVPGEWTEVRVQIPVFAHTFRAGSAIRLTINTPGGDTAQWEFELDGPGAEATHVIGTGTDHPSSIALPVIAGLTAPTPPAHCQLRGQPCRPAPAIANVVVSDAPPTVIHDDRPAQVIVPDSYDAGESYPLVVLLHGFGASGSIQATYMGLTGLVDDREFVLVTPDGTLGPGGRFWNAIPKCCDDGSDIDDVAYVGELIDEAISTYSIDPQRVYLVGHSNGGMMSFTMACERPLKITAIASLAGSSFDTDAECAPADDPVSVLMIHGTADATVNYFDGFYPSVATVRERHAALLGCDPGVATAGTDLDLVQNLPGDETTVERFETGCEPGTSVEVWTIVDGVHIPFPSPDFGPNMIDWLLARTKG